MRKVIKGIVIFILIIAAIIGILIIDEEYISDIRSRRHAKDNIELQTGIEIPEEAKIIYHDVRRGFFQGRRPQYTVFEFDKEPTQWLADSKFLFCDMDENSEDIRFGTFWDYFGDGVIDEEQVPEEYWPSFTKDFYSKEKALVFFYYYPDTLRLIVYVSWT